LNAHFDVDVDPVMTHGLVNSADNLSSITQAQALLHGDGTTAFGDAGYLVVEKRQEMRATR
jgi:IS5 family transposase